MSRAPLVEILGPWLQNNGDGLNLHSVVQRLGRRAQLGVSSTLGLDRLPDEPRLLRIKWAPDRASFGDVVRAGSASGAVRVIRDRIGLTLAPRTLLAARQIASGRAVTALVDCSGYAYGDVWSTRRVERRVEYYRRLKRQGSVVILLPQAFGPFERPEVRRCSRELFDHCALIYPRDDVSRRHLEGIGCGEALRPVVPDITHLVAGLAPSDAAAWTERVAIVPNARMMDRTSPERSQRYFDFLVLAIRLVRARRFEPYLVVHERNDVPLARQLRDAVPFEIGIADRDALASKGILGACHAVIGSRYHALVSALAQGVPAIGTSWSHKYEALFEDYGCPENLLAPEGETARLEAALDRSLEWQSRARQAALLAERARQQRARVEAMWTEVEARIFSG